DAGGNRDVERAPVWQGDARLGAVHRVEEIDFKAILGIGPAHRESSTATSALAHAATLAEQIAEQVAEGADILEARRRAIARPVLASGIFAVVVLLWPLLPRRVDLAPVVPPALLGIAKDVVGGGDLLEHLLGRLVAGIEVGMQFLGELAIGLGDVPGTRRLRHAKNCIEVFCHRRVYYWSEINGQWLLDSRFRGNDKVGHHLGREPSLGKPRLARSELECRAHADLGLAMEQIGEVLEPPLDSLPFEIRIGLR